MQGMSSSCAQPVPGSHSMSLTMAVVLRGFIISSVLCVVRAQSHDNCGTSVGALVTSGRPIVAGEYPWLAALYMRDNVGNYDQFCGGALLTPNLVITAAHCLVNEGEVVDPDNILVGLGKLHRSLYVFEMDGFIAHVREVIVPENYVGTLSSFALDVGLLKLSMTVEVTDYILPVCIDLDTMKSVPTGASVHAAGWGTSENGTSTDKALAADMSYLDYQGCLRQVRLLYRRYVTHDKICTLKTQGGQVDRGDSGGALTFSKNERHYIIGIVSTKVRDQTAFSIFTDLKNAEIHFWLQTHIERTKLTGQGKVVNFNMTATVSADRTITPIKIDSDISERAFDCVTNKMYYWSKTHKAIMAETLDGKKVTTVKRTGSDEFLGQTVDWIKRRIYFIDIVNNDRELISLDLHTKITTDYFIRFKTDTNHLTIHPSLRKIYILTGKKRVEYINTNFNPPTPILFHEEEKPWVANIAIDWQTNELCLLYGGNETAAIKCKHLMTEEIRNVLSGFPRSEPLWWLTSFIITPSDYQWGYGMKVHKLPKSSSAVESITSSSNVGEIVFFPETCPNLTPPQQYIQIPKSIPLRILQFPPFPK